MITIGQLAQKSGTDAQTIRYYERQRLMPEPNRTNSNYRLYAKDAIERLTFIKRAKEIGFSLNDIKVLLGMADGKVRRCSDIQKFAETRLSKIRAQISDLQAMEKTLSDLVRQCGFSDRITECPIIETLSEKR
jgi:MerR family mercuric resistance operon transcriptional regulator